jgi:hypothetical protein
LVTFNYNIAINSINKQLEERRDVRRVTKVEYNDLISFVRKGINIVFDCKDKKYLNKCTVEGENIESPFEFLIKVRVQAQPVQAQPVQVTTVQVTPSTLRPDAPAFVPKAVGGFIRGLSNNDYKQKYFKYKEKYLQLKKTIKYN